MYGLAKVHKQLINNCPPFRPILSAIGTPTYNIAKFLVPILKPLTTNDYTLKDTFEFSHEILSQNPHLFMASLDVDSLFTNITLDETINIIIKKLFSENESINITTKILEAGFHVKKTLSSNSFWGLLFVCWTLKYNEKNRHYFLVTSSKLFMKPFLSRSI